MKYKEGDKAMVRRNLKAGELIRCGVIPEMEELAGKIVTIKRVHDASELYTVKENTYAWTDEMLEPAFVQGGIVGDIDPRLVDASGGNGATEAILLPALEVVLGKMKYNQMRFTCGSINICNSLGTTTKSGIKTRKEIRKKLLNL